MQQTKFDQCWLVLPSPPSAPWLVDQFETLAAKLKSHGTARPTVTSHYIVYGVLWNCRLVTRSVEVMKRGKEPPKGQRSIASFVFKKAISSAGHGEPHSSKDAKDLESTLPKTAQSDHFDPDAENERSSKRARPTRNVQPPRSKSSLVNAHDRHVKWQNKLLGDETAGFSRIRTQDALKQAVNGQVQKMTPLELQVSTLQAQHPDCILAIECGYKYRFFGRDAEVASEVLGIFSYPDRNFLTAGIPTATIDRHVRRLAMAGYKVGVVQQTESAAIKAASDNRYKPFERKLSAIYTRSTLEAGPLAAARPKKCATENHNDDDQAGFEIDDQGHGEMPNTMAVPTVTGKMNVALETNEQQSSHLVCIMEAEPEKSKCEQSKGRNSGGVEIAVIAIEPSTGKVLHALLTDSPMRAELQSCLMFVAPAELLLVLPLSTETRRLAESFATTSSGGRSVRMEMVTATNNFIDDAQAIRIIDQYSCLGVNPQETLHPLVSRCLAYSLEHLKPFGLNGVLRDRPHLSLALTNFAEVQELSLSPNALSQLEVLRNADDGREKGSLLWLMDRTVTPAGARLVRRWVSRPLRSVALIRQRLQAVQEIVQRGIHHPIISALPVTLRSLPDFERILGRVLHGTSSPPEFVSLLKSFSDLYKKLGLEANIDGNNGVQHLSGTIDEEALDIKSPLLKTLFMAAGNLQCVAASKETLAAIDPVAAASGDMERLFVDETRFADVMERRHKLESARHMLDDLLPDLARALNVRSVSYVNVTNQGNYLVEVPVELEKRVPKQWQRVSSTKKVLRYRPPEVKSALAELELAEEYVAVTARGAWKRLQAEFSKEYSNLFRSAVDALAALDCLNGFASLAATGNYVCPEFITDDEEPQLHVVGGRHPILDVLLEGRFVPNDIMLGGIDGHHRCAVITGPNMGGKSCYIRQAALIACMAQAGSFVPAVSCKLHAFDAIYTRMGAADNIALGRSTFLEELGEASAILNKATRRSLVIMDELGRGTSTQDGKAIAAATLEYFVHRIGCLLLFVTHYPEVARLGLISGGGGAACFHMAHVVEAGSEQAERGDNAADALPPRVTFLYKLTSGVAEASYGLNVARMAGLPKSVVRRAYEKAQEVEGAAQAEHFHDVGRTLSALGDSEREEDALKAQLMALRRQIHSRMGVER